ncbi:MAG: hypothetical protein ACMX3H_14555 [Sodalis sp. (in: enterobacteria)]|uniref:hypothetical protein n=1 Tax=Sodalis sp. (in: enterobacteria) TaxID=1898979 RepID=UPI0039E45768
MDGTKAQAEYRLGGEGRGGLAVRQGVKRGGTTPSSRRGAIARIAQPDSRCWGHRLLQPLWRVEILTGVVAGGIIAHYAEDNRHRNRPVNALR